MFIVDGVDVSNIRSASLGTSDAIPFEFVQEVQVKSGGFEAEFGGALGGVVNVISKSGSDVYRGEALYQFTGSSAELRGRAARSGATRLIVTKAEFFQPPEDDSTSQYFGVTVGGPIIKDRLRFFAGYVPEMYNTDRSINFVTARAHSASRLVPEGRCVTVATAASTTSPAQSLQIKAPTSGTRQDDGPAHGQ